MGARGGCRPGELDGVRGVVRADARDDPRAVADGPDDDFEEARLLLIRGGRRFAGGAGDDELVVAEVDEMGGGRFDDRVVDGPVLGEGRCLLYTSDAADE